MEINDLIREVVSNYMIVTLACVIFGYIVTTTPYLQRLKDSVPIIVTVIGALLAVALHGYTVNVVILGALAGILSTGLYELFGKGIKKLGEYLEGRITEQNRGDE